MTRCTKFLISLTNTEAMVDKRLLSRLYDLAFQAATERGGRIVEIGAFRGASTVALAKGARNAGRGHVYSIDPHRNYHGVHGGLFSPDDHAVYETTLRSHGVTEWVTHYCSTSADVAKAWTGSIDLLWIDGDHSYKGVAEDLNNWLSFVAPDGIVVLDDYYPGTDVAAAVRDYLPFANFIVLEQTGSALVLKRTREPRTLVLCGGMQSSGSTLVSMCFLQRGDMDGVYDLDNPLIQQDFSKVYTSMVWVKMTIGSFRLAELEDLYLAQGWQVRSILVTRDIEEILNSLVHKWYGLDGCTGDDPPLRIRMTRYLLDKQDASSSGWVVLNYDDLLHAPEATLRKVCEQLSLPWDDRMLAWPKSASSFAYPDVGNESLRALLRPGKGLIGTISSYIELKRKNDESHNPNTLKQIRQLLTIKRQSSDAPMPPCRYHGTRREILERNYWQLKLYIDRLWNHRLIGCLLCFWVRYINPALLPPRFKSGEGK